MLGFLREGLRRLLRLPTRPIEMHVTVIPPALEPLPGIELKDTNLAV
jgi:hypothetical protein